VLSIIWTLISLYLFFNNLLLPLAVVIIDSFCFTFFVIAMAGTGSAAITACMLHDADSTLPCSTFEASFAFEVLAMFVPALSALRWNTH
jgi:hypothetical protein